MTTTVIGLAQQITDEQARLYLTGCALTGLLASGNQDTDAVLRDAVYYGDQALTEFKGNERAVAEYEARRDSGTALF